MLVQDTSNGYLTNMSIPFDFSFDFVRLRLTLFDFVRLCSTSFDFVQLRLLFNFFRLCSTSFDFVQLLSTSLSRCVVLIGSGNGANVGAYYVTHYSRLNHDGGGDGMDGMDGSEENEEPLSRVLRCVMLVNMFSHLDKGLTRALKRMIRLHRSAVHAERVVNLAALMFSSRYMEEHTRQTVLHDFYTTRHPPKQIQDNHHHQVRDIETCWLDELYS